MITIKYKHKGSFDIFFQKEITRQLPGSRYGLEYIGENENIRTITVDDNGVAALKVLLESMGYEIIEEVKEEVEDE